MSNTKPQLTSKDWEKNCPKCGGRCWRDEHPDGYMVGPWNCEDCSWFESNPNLPVHEDWIERFDFEIGQVWNSGTDYDQYDKSGVVKSFIQQEIDKVVEEATRKERERCLKCVDELKRKIWMPKGVPIEDGELDTIQGILDSQNKRVVELEKAVTASNTWNLALDEIQDKIKKGGEV